RQRLVGPHSRPGDGRRRGSRRRGGPGRLGRRCGCGRRRGRGAQGTAVGRTRRRGPGRRGQLPRPGRRPHLRAAPACRSPAPRGPPARPRDRAGVGPAAPRATTTARRPRLLAGAAAREPGPTPWGTGLLAAGFFAAVMIVAMLALAGALASATHGLVAV